MLKETDLMLCTIGDIRGQIKKSDERYIVKDNATLSDLVLSSTELNPKMATSGHTHKGQEEIYIFIAGAGSMIVAPEKPTGKFIDRIPVGPNSIVLVPDGYYHRVFNETLGSQLYFLTVFAGARSH
tara:strand:+ start:4754 stop:5131 length:378 start_codon:yes stop_codon:yes gene_type:complete